MKENWKCVVISDTHGDMRPIREVIEREKPFDTLVHCGDVEGSLSAFLGVQTFGYLSVRGNCDLLTDDAKELCFQMGGCRIFVTHGHRFHARYGLEGLVLEGRKQRADVILCGHTHVPDIYRDTDSGILLVNPGSLSRPRQSPREKTYAVLTISEGGVPSAEIRKL